MLGDDVTVYLDGGPTGGGYDHDDGQDAASTIVDATDLMRPGGSIRIVRHGVISDAAILEVIG
jgi:L-threonylcarbamoyladenylate synthase